MGKRIIIKKNIEMRIKFHLPEGFSGPEFEQCELCGDAHCDLQYKTCIKCRDNEKM